MHYLRCHFNETRAQRAKRLFDPHPKHEQSAEATDMCQLLRRAFPKALKPKSTPPRARGTARATAAVEELSSVPPRFVKAKELLDLS